MSKTDTATILDDGSVLLRGTVIGSVVNKGKHFSAYTATTYGESWIGNAPTKADAVDGLVDYSQKAYREIADIIDSLAGL